MTDDGAIAREWHGDGVVLRVAGVFDRSAAWALRDTLTRESAREVLVDFSLVRDFSDLGVAVLAHGLQSARQRVLFRGLRQHQLRIFRYCGLLVEETIREAIAVAAPGAPPEKRA